MKKRILALLLSIVLVLGLVTVSFAANGTGHKISVKIYKVVLDSSKPLGYQNPELINTITVTCQDSTGHSGYNHSANLKDFYPTNVGAATTDWTGWEFASYYTKGQEQKPFYNWIRDTVNATANVTGSEPYPCSKNFYLVYKDTTPSVDTYTVTYTDGVDGEVVFPDQVTSGLKAGTATPAFAGGTPTRRGYVFAGWKPAVAGTVTGNATYVAQWKVDANGNGIADDEETKYTVIYTDGAANGAAFAEQKHPNLLSGTPTPKWQGMTDEPKWEDHVFVGWEPKVAEKVTESVKYVAQWKDDKNHNGIDDDLEDKLTVIYNDGEAEGASFADQKHENLLPGTATPAWKGMTDEPKWEDHVFVGWEPKVAEKVTESVKYVAQWKDDKNGNGTPDDEETKYTVTYTDGVENEEIFKDQVYEGLLSGEATPKFEGKEPTRKGYVFAGWKPAVAEKVTGNATYVAQWKEDKNGNGTPDDEETKYTVTYTDGVENEEIFKDQVYEGLLSGEATPKFEGKEPTRKGYVFAGWKPAVAEKVTGNATYVAQWKEDKNGNGTPDDEETKYTVTYTDGVEGEEVFKDQVYEGLLSGEATPAFAGGTPTREGYVFAGWKPAVAEKVTGNATYVAQWKKLDAAQTGDTMNLTVWYCLLGAAGICFVAAFVLAKKKQSDK